MSTQSYICKEQADGSYYGIYCCMDGYLNYNGRVLITYYNSSEAANEIIALGDIATLQPKLYPDNNLGKHGFEYAERQEGVTVAFGRDRGDEGTEAQIVTLEQAKQSMCEFMYIYGCDGKWKYYDLNNKTPKLIEVEMAL